MVSIKVVIILSVICLENAATSIPTRQTLSDTDRKRANAVGEKILNIAGRRHDAESTLPEDVNIFKNPAILGGYNAKKSVAKNLAFIDIFKNEGKVNVNCTGVLISADRVLTAAHCFLNPGDEPEMTEVRVSLGIRKVSPSSYPYETARYVHWHALYEGGSYKNDIAIITLSSSTTEPTATLASRELDKNERLFAAGYGSTTDPNVSFYTAPDVLQEVELKARPFKKCYKREEKGNKEDISEDSMICATVPKWKVSGVDTCKGDSGGPLYQKEGKNTMVVYGLTSFGNFGCGISKKGAWYVKILHYRSPVLRHISVGDEIDRISEWDWTKLKFATK